MNEIKLRRTPYLLEKLDGCENVFVRKYSFVYKKDDEQWATSPYTIDRFYKEVSSNEHYNFTWSEFDKDTFEKRYRHFVELEPSINDYW